MTKRIGGFRRIAPLAILAILALGALDFVPGCGSPAPAPSRAAGATEADAQAAGSRALAPERVPTAERTSSDPSAAALAEDPALERARALFDAARAAQQRGDHSAARASAAEAIDVLLSGARAAIDTRADLLFELGSLAHDEGELTAARSARERVLEVRSRTLPDDDPDLQVARRSLALTMYSQGDLDGARALFEKALEVSSRTLPGDHPDLQVARQDLAAAIKAQGDFAGAQALEEKTLEVRSRSLPDDHPDLQVSRLNLAATLYSRGDLAGARPLFEKVLEVLSRTLPDDHPDLQVARGNLAATIKEQGDLAGARALEEKVLEVDSRRLPGDHPDLQRARGNLAGTMYSQGDLAGARALFENVLEVYSRTLPGDHPELQHTRLSFAMTIQAQGDCVSARVLEEKVLEVFSRTLPDDHPDLQRARGNLAVTMWSQGDLAGARALFEKVLEVFSSALPDDHPDLQRARGNLAVTMHAQGDFAGARGLFEKVLDVNSRTLPDDHPDLQGARGNLAATIKELGDLAGARVLEEKVLEVSARTLPSGHPDLQAARLNLALTLKAQGDLAGARALFEKVLEVSLRAYPDDHPHLQSARQDLAVTIAALSASALDSREEARARCAALVLELCRAQTRAARAVLLSAPSREAEERCTELSEKLDVSLSFSRGYGVFDRTSALETASFELSETTRGAALSATSLGRRAAGDPRYAELRLALVRASEDLSSLVRKEDTTSAEFDRARRKREGIERELIALSPERSDLEPAGMDLDPASLAAKLGAGAAAVGFRRFRDWRVEDRGGTQPPAPREVFTDRLCAFVVQGTAPAAPLGAGAVSSGNEDRGSELTLVDLGPVEPIERAVHAWRSALGVAPGRGVASALTAASSDESTFRTSLGKLVLDPLLPALRGSERVVLALDDVLHLVPFDALPLDTGDGALLGDRIRIETRSTLIELLDGSAAASTAGGFVGLGGASYDGDESDAAGAEVAGTAEAETRVEVAGVLRGSPWSGGFAALPATAREIEGIGASFALAFGPERKLAVLQGTGASKERLFALAPGARFLHVATHGWFAPESIRSWSDRRPIDEKSGLGLRLSGEEEVKGMSPMLLCGLALAGANLPEDALGRTTGLVTAEEIAALDLSDCELAVLSACDTNVGERRAGQGVASLQRALQMAGARSVITSLWKVPDEATKELMLDFYRRIWVEKKPKRQALWEAKKKLRDARDERGEHRYTTRDWAAWVLSGDPD